MEKDKIIIYLLAALVVLAVFNQFQIFSLAGSTKNSVNSNTGTTNDIGTGFATGIKDVNALDVIPKGVPEIYGKELGIRYDDVNVNNPEKADLVIKKLATLDNSISLEGNLLERYIKITNSISCEYCCGAAAITFSDGSPACGCAHSFAMRGVAKYLLKTHPEMSDESILEELGKWKTLFFPDTLNAKASVLKQQGIELNYINLASNKYRGIEKGAQGGNMVGGC